MWKQISKKLEISLAIAPLIYLLSPLACLSRTWFYQGVKGSETICILIFCTLSVWTLRFIRTGTLCFEFTKIDLVFLIYSIYITTLCIMQWGTLDREVLFLYMTGGLLFLQVRTLNAGRIHLIFFIFPFLLLWQLWYGIAFQTQYFFPGKGMDLIQGSFLNTGLWSCFVACVFVILLGKLCQASSLLGKLCHGAGIILCIWMLYIGNSRSAWLGLAIGGGFLIFQQMGNQQRFRKPAIILLLGAILIGSGIATCHKIHSTLGRWLIWKISGGICIEHPWGSGINGFQHNYMAYQEQYFAQGGHIVEKMLADDTSFAFNDVLRIFIEQGIIGLFLTALLLFYILKKTDSSNRFFHEYSICKGVLLTWLTFSLFSYPGSQLQTKAIFILFTAMLSALSSPVWKIESKRIGLMVICIGILSGITIFKQEIYPYHRAVEKWNSDCKSKKISSAELPGFYQPLMNSPYFLSNFSLLLNRQGDHAEALELAARGISLYNSYGCCIEKGIALENMKQYASAEEAWVKAGNLIPNRFKPLYLRMEMWEKAGNTKYSSMLADTILHKSIKVTSPELIYFLERAKKVKQNPNVYEK